MIKRIMHFLWFDFFSCKPVWFEFIFSISRRSILLFAMVFLAACASTPIRQGDVLPGLALYSSSEQILFTWAEDTPLARNLRPNTQFELIASYHANGRLLGETASRSQMGNDGQSVIFDLPLSLTNIPEGPICLRIRNGFRQLIPLRLPEAGFTSDGFTYGEWSNAVKYSTAIKIKQAEINDAERNLNAVANIPSSLSSYTNRTNISSLAQCAAITAQVDVEPPKTVMLASEYNIEAAKQCSWQFERSIPEFRRAELLPVLESAADSIEISENYHDELLNYIELYKSIDNTMIENPDFFSERSERKLPNLWLPTTRSVDDLLYDSNEETTATLVIGILDAYSSCHIEAVNQFRQSSEDWVEEQNPQLLNARTELLQNECRAYFDTDSSLNSEIARLSQRRDELSLEFEALQMSASSITLPSDTRSLLRNSCPKGF